VPGFKKLFLTSICLTGISIYGIASPTLGFLRIPPGNRLEKMSGDLEGFWSVRINDQWRIVFKWIDNDAYDVKITDYH